MRILKNIVIKNYGPFQKAELQALSDLNVLIGPNNCGKTSILEAIAFLRMLGKSAGGSEQLGKPGVLGPGLTTTGPVVLSKRPDLGSPVSISYEFDEGVLVPSGVDSALQDDTKAALHDGRIQTSGPPDGEWRLHFQNRLEAILKPATLQGTETTLSATGSNLLTSPEFIEWLVPRGRVVVCGDNRLNLYNGMAPGQYLQSKDMASAVLNDVTDRVRKMVDPTLGEFYPASSTFECQGGARVQIPSFGSGIRAFVGLAADIVNSPEGAMILIDEPETGLHPHAKHEFLLWLLNEVSEKRQVFISTHDPSFVNPVLLRDVGERVSVFLHSALNSQFVKFQRRDKEVFPSFAGVLSHVHTCKDVHLYVEGKEDIWVFKRLLDRFLTAKGCWRQLRDRIGVFHLNGSFWVHLLGTIPVQPFTSVVLLDGNKRTEAADVLKEGSKHVVERFRVCEKPEDFSAARLDGKIPLYCLEKNDIREYFPDCKSKEDAELKARTADIPGEIARVFDCLIKITGGG